MELKLNTDTSTEIRVIRSFLFTPGNHPRKVEKVFGAAADAVILDLEDAVAIAEKVATRETVVQAMKQPRSCLGYIRVNALDTGYCEEDIKAVIGPWLDGIVIPKVESAATILAVDALISAAEREANLPIGSIDLMPIIETACGVEYATEIASASPRVRRLSFGGGDYTLDLDYIWSADEEVLSYARARISHATRVANIDPPIDTVVLQINDNERFCASAERGKKFGFTGKLCIHPSQVPLCNTTFTPSAEEIAHAEAVVTAFEAAEAAGSASIQLDGYFIDYPIVYKSQRILALAKKLSQ
ncbi:MAG: citrate lyase subunit beta/citryl-CoA lyase [Halieaceae bacterium]|jgi:citrate lyase subunit beta/citryl-CoA lyase